ncbi:MAG: beta strand repeat-containing protein [Bacteroidales bacterium]
MANTPRYFSKGIELRGETADLSNNVEGTIFNNSTVSRLKVYIGAAVREIITADQAQTLTNKTISGANNTITNIPVTALTAIIDTDLNSVSALDDTIPSAKATKAYIDQQVLTKDAANEIAFTPAGSIAATDVQAAVVEVSGDIDNHKSQVSGAHAASAIANTASGNLAATDVQAALNELQSDVDTRATSSALSSHTGATSAHGVSGAIVGTSDSQTLTNKTIVATSNTISAIADANIASAAAIARTKLASGTTGALLNNNGSGVMSESTDIILSTNAMTLASTKHLELQAATDSTTTGTAASLTAFTGGAIRLTNASLVSLANIPAGANGQQVVIFNRTGASVSIVDSSATSGTAANRIYTGTSANIAFAKDAALILSYDSTSSRWQVIGGTGGGSSELPLGVLAQQTFESAVLTDFTQTGLTLVTASNLLIKNAKAAQLVSNASVTQSFKQVIAVDNQFRGKNLTVDLYTRSSATQGNVTVLFYNETSAVNLVASQAITLCSTTISATTAIGTTLSALSVADVNKLKVGQTITGSGIVAGTTIASINTTALTATLSQAATAAATVTLRISDLPQRQSFSFDVPTNCASLSYTISALAEANAPESYFDDIVFKLTATALTSTSITLPVNNDTDWVTFTPTGTWTTNTTYAGKWRRVGDSMEMTVSISLTGAPNSSALGVNTPSGYFIDETKLNYLASVASVGVGHIVQSSTARGYALVAASQQSLNRLLLRSTETASNSTINQAVPVTFANGDTITLTASVPIQTWSSNQTTSTTIPLTTAQLVQTPDSTLRVSGLNGNGSVGTQIRRFSTIDLNVGSDISYQDSATNGASFTVLTSGTYSISYTDSFAAGASYLGISLNAVSLTTGVSSSPVSTEILAKEQTTGADTPAMVSWEGYLNAQDIIRPKTNGAANGAQGGVFTISKQGSLKQLNVSSDAKITIPTHSLRFEGASTRGSTDTAIVKFDTQAITQGDGFSVVNTAANGTVITMLKAGTLNISASIYAVASSQLIISRNQTVLTSAPTIASERIAAEFTAGTNDVQSASASVLVNIGDKIRVVSTVVPTISDSNILSLSLTENSIPANFSNVLPQWSQSDSAIELNTANGFGSSAATTRRFSNNPINLGTSVSYVDSVTLGAQFTINEDSDYNIVFTDSGTTSTDVIIKVNGVTRGISSSSGVNSRMTSVFSGFLSKNDIVTFARDAASTGSVPADTRAMITKVGKPNLTSVDVTPFVNMKTTDVEAIESNAGSSTMGSTATGVYVINIAKNTNLGIIQVVSDAVNGTSFKALKDCTVNISATASNTSANNQYFTKNSTGLVANSGSGIFAATTMTAGYSTTFSGSVKLLAGDVIRVQTQLATNNTLSYLSLTATADNNATASPTQQVSSDTMAFAFKATAIDPAVDAIGTFNTYTYAINTNTATIAGTAPTQTTSSMNINGIQVFARAYNAASTAASPARADVFIGKGLKSRELDAYFNTGKTTQVYIPTVVNSSTEETGSIFTYNETTGILSIDAGLTRFTANTSRYFLDAATNVSRASAYFVFNASRSASLTTIPNLQQRVAYLSDVKASGTASGSAGAATTQTRTLNTIVDSTGIVTSLASNQFTLSKGVYNIEASAPAFATNNHRTRIRNITDSTTALLGTSEYATLATTSSNRSFVTGEISITSAKVFELQHYTLGASASNGLGVQTGSGESEVYATVKITKIKDI